MRTERRASHERRHEDLTHALSLRACAILAGMILEGDPLVTKDESGAPELRDVCRIANGDKPLTNAGKWAAEAGRERGRTDR